MINSWIAASISVVSIIAVGLITLEYIVLGLVISAVTFYAIYRAIIWFLEGNDFD